MLDRNADNLKTIDASTNTNYTILENPKNKISPEPKPPKLKELVPYHVRLKNYLEKKEEIYNTPPLIDPSRRILNTRIRFKKRKAERKVIASAILSSKNDLRPHLDILIENIPYTGLLDSGASVSCLGQNCLEFVDRLNIPIIDYFETIKTADGKPQKILGKIRVNINSNDNVKSMLLYLVPSLSQPLYLGIDFWNMFQLKPCFVNKSLQVEEISVPISTDTSEPFRITRTDQEEPVERDKPVYQMHELTPEQNFLLEQAKSHYKCYSQFGLGKTHLEEHVIDTGDAPPKKREILSHIPSYPTTLL